VAGTLHSYLTHGGNFSSVYLASRPISGPPVTQSYNSSQYVPSLHFITPINHFLIYLFPHSCSGSYSQRISSSHIRRTHHNLRVFDTLGVAPLPTFGASPWLITYVLLRFLRRSRSHPRCSLNSTYAIQRSQHVDALIQHVLTLSLSWHTRHKAGGPIGFTVIPVDICFALVMFVFRFEFAVGALVGVMMGSYI
jgi:hypothetical protein